MDSSLSKLNKILLPPDNTLGSKRNRNILRRIYEKRLYFLVFAIPFLIMYVVYAFFKVHPFGENSVLVLDLNGQYVYYYEAFRDAFWGDGSFIYSFNRNLSGEMFGIFGYYLASPFMLVICLLPRTMMCGAIELMQLLKIGTAAVTFAFFIRRTFSAKNSTVVIFSTCYALMSYMVVELMDPMWLDGLIYLPLIIYGVSKLVDTGKLLNFIIPLALMFAAHFYIGYMVGIFTGIYFVAYLFLRNKKIRFSDIVVSCLKFAVGTIIAIMCAMIVLLPVVKSLSLGKFEFSVADFSFRTQFELLEFFSKLFPMTYDTVNVDGLPMIFSGTLTVLMLPVYYVNKKIAWKEKALATLVCAAVIISMYIAPIDLFWHGMQAPNWLNYRYSFVLSFMLIFIAARTFDSSDGFSYKALGGSLVGIFAFLVFAEIQGLSYFTTYSSGTDEMGEPVNKAGGILFSFLAVAVYFALVSGIKKAGTNKLKSGLKIALCAVVCLEMGIVSFDTLQKIDDDVAYSNYTSYEDYMTEMRRVVDGVQDGDGGLHRMEKTFLRTVCDPMGMGYAGISHSSSTMNTPALTMLHALGYGYGGNYTVYNGSTYVNDMLFDIKYLLSKSDDIFSSFAPVQIKNVPSLYQKTDEYEVVDASSDTMSKGTISVYKNPYASSYAYMADESVLNLSLLSDNVFENQNNLLCAVTDKKEEYLVPLAFEEAGTENLAAESMSDGTTRYFHAADEAAECHIDYVVTMNEDGPFYMYLPTNYERKCNVWYYDDDEFMEAAEQTGGEPAMDFAGSYFEGDDYRILSLGDYSKGDKIRIRITVITEAYWKAPCFYTIDRDAFETAAQTIKENSLDVTEHTDRSLRGTVTAKAGQVLLTTIPYEDGWKIEVDGKPVSPKKAVDGALIAIEVPEGEHTISMTFMPDYFVFAILISVLGLLICAVIFVLQYKNGTLYEKIRTKFKS